MQRAHRSNSTINRCCIIEFEGGFRTCKTLTDILGRDVAHVCSVALGSTHRALSWAGGSLPEVDSSRALTIEHSRGTFPLDPVELNYRIL